MYFNKIFTLVLIAGLGACREEPGSDVKYSEDFPKPIDSNGDGVEDVFFQFESDGDYVLSDRNYDNKVDRSDHYSAEGLYLRGTRDDNFDGYPDTQVVARNGQVTFILIDVEQDNLIDIVYEYNAGRLMTAERYYASKGDDDSASIGRVRYRFDYPRGKEEREFTTLTAGEFHDKATLLVGDVP